MSAFSAIRLTPNVPHKTDLVSHTFSLVDLLFYPFFGRVYPFRHDKFQIKGRTDQTRRLCFIFYLS